jgi:heptosyltransferase-2
VNRVIIFAPNWLGDAVMSLPAIADLRRGWPDASMTVAARRSVAPLFAMVRDVDDVVVIARWGLSLEPAPRTRFDTAVLFPNSFRSALLAWHAGADERWGYRGDWRGSLLTRAIDPAPADMHQGQKYQMLVHALGVTNGCGAPRLDLGAEMRADGARLLERSGWDGRAPLVALAPGAAYGSSKRWPPEYFAAVARALAADGVLPAIVGGRGDTATGLAIEAALGSARALNLIGPSAPDLPTLAGALSHARLLVANDSGPLHLGAALGIPAIAMFGPTDERRTAPRTNSHADSRAADGDLRAGGPNLVVLTNPVWCRPCWLRECPLDHACLRGVHVETVVAAARRML